MDILQHARAQSKLTLEKTYEQTEDTPYTSEKGMELKHVTTPKFEHLFDLFARMRLPPGMYTHIQHIYRVKRMPYKPYYKIAQRFLFRKLRTKSIYCT